MVKLRGGGRFVICKQIGMNVNKLDPVGSTVRYEMIKLCTGSVRTLCGGSSW